MTPDRPLSFRFPLLRGEDVRCVQQALIRAGLPAGEADGVFGPATRDAVLAFQQRAGLPRDGVVGPQTWAQLLPAAPAVRVDADWTQRLRPYLARLLDWHGAPVGPGQYRWRLTAQGVQLEGEAEPRRTPGAPRTATAAWRAFGAAMQEAATNHGVPVELLLAIACTETAGRADAVRLEPGYVNDEVTPQRVSPGLMQTLISTARAALHDPGLDRARLLDPAVSLRAAAAYLRQQATAGRLPTGYDPPLVGAAYNAGSLRPSGGNPWGLVQTLHGPDRAYADVLLGFLNDGFAVLAEAPPPQEVPSFRALLLA